MDQMKYVNTYIDVAVGTLNENTVQILQLKTQNRVANDLLSEKDAIIGKLTSEIESLRNGIDDISSLRSQNEELRSQQTGMINKLSHMDSLLNQVSDMKQQIINLTSIISEKDDAIKRLQDEIEELKNSSTKVINKKNTVKKKEEEVVFTEKETKVTSLTLDDF